MNSAIDTTAAKEAAAAAIAAQEAAAAAAAAAATTAEALSDVDSGIEELNEELAKLRKKRVGLLKPMTTVEREFLIKLEAGVERTESMTKKASELKKNRTTTEEDKDQLAAARLTHKATINEPRMKLEASEYVKMAYLQSYRLTHRKDGKLGLAIRGII
jgi:chromosome segregation ATPase